MHPTQIPSADSIHIKKRQVRQIANGAYHVIPNHAVTINIALAIPNPIPQAKRFCIAHTYSGFWLLTMKRQSILNGARVGHHRVLIRNCIRNAITVGYK